MDTLQLTVGDNTLDAKLAKPLELARNNRVEAQRLALDCTQLLSKASDRVQEISQQGFFQRIWGRFNGVAIKQERATQHDMVQMQRMAFRYLENLGEQNLLTLDAVAAVRNQLSYVLADAKDTKQELRHLAQETRSVILKLVDTMQERFDSLEKRIERIETASAIHGWLLTIDDFEYDRYPESIRLLKIVADYRTMKDTDWTADDFRCLKTALRRTGIDPMRKIRVEEFIRQVAVDSYTGEYSAHIRGLLEMDKVDADRVKDQLSLPLLACLYSFAGEYDRQAKTVKRLASRDHVSTSPDKAISDLMIDCAREAGIDTDAQVEYRHLALELMTGISMARQFAPKNGFVCATPGCVHHDKRTVFMELKRCNQCGQHLIPV